nr:TPA_asm: m119.3 uORF 1 [Murid betaherpesvirus 1]DBA08084.1 TPA_asm: m119.3 uORF 1 [Murid betaherpesvirus 1]
MRPSDTIRSDARRHRRWTRTNSCHLFNETT